MKPSSQWVLAILVMASLAALFAWALGSFEPRYQGLPASRYLRAVLSTNATPSATQTAVTLVPARVAVPILIEFTQTQDSRWRGWYQRLYPRLPLALQKRFGPPNSSDLLVQQSVRALGCFGPDAKSAVPRLLELEAACDQLLTNFQRTAVSPRFLQGIIFSTLGSIGPDATEAIPHLVTYLQRPPAHDVAMALAEIDISGEQVAPAFVRALKDRFAASAAVEGLSKIASRSPRWIDDLWDAAEDSSLPVSMRAAQHVITLGGLTRERVGIILARTSHPKPEVRRHAAEILSYTTRFAPDTLPALLRLREDTDQAVRQSAIRALAWFARDRQLPPDLRLSAARAALDRNDASQSWDMLVVIAALGSAEVTTDDILPFLSDANERLGAKAAETLSRVGMTDERARPALEQLLSDKWESVRDAARSALVQRQRAPVRANPQ